MFDSLPFRFIDSSKCTLFVMSALTLMKHNQRLMAIFAISLQPITSPLLNWLRWLSAFVITIAMIACVALAALYVYQESRLPLMLEAVVLVLGASASLFSYLNMIWNRNSVVEMNTRLQEMVDEGTTRTNCIPSVGNENGLSWTPWYFHDFSHRTNVSGIHLLDRRTKVPAN